MAHASKINHSLGGDGDGELSSSLNHNHDLDFQFSLRNPHVLSLVSLWATSKCLRREGMNCLAPPVVAIHGHSWSLIFTLQFPITSPTATDEVLKILGLFIIQEAQSCDSLPTTRSLQCQERKMTTDHRSGFECNARESSISLRIVQIRQWQVYRCQKGV